MEEGLRLNDLTIQRGGIPILAGIKLSLLPGEAVILSGANGIGKTSLLRSLAGLQPPLAGNISYPSASEETCAYSAHADGVKGALSVEENLAFWAQIYGHDEAGLTQSLDAALSALNLTPLRHRRASELSAGQKRRLGLARLMLTHRPIWLMDEPSVSLDHAGIALLVKVIKGHLDQGGMALIASHVLLEIPHVAQFDLTPYHSKAHLFSAPHAYNGFDEALS